MINAGVENSLRAVREWEKRGKRYSCVSLSFRQGGLSHAVGRKRTEWNSGSPISSFTLPVPVGVCF